MSEYKALLEKKRELDAQIEMARKAEFKGAFEKVRSLVSEFGLTPSDIFPVRRAKANRVLAAATPKYRDPDTGKTWSGRGKPPLWIAGKDRQQFAI